MNVNSKINDLVWHLCKFLLLWILTDENFIIDLESYFKFVQYVIKVKDIQPVSTKEICNSKLCIVFCPGLKKKKINK